MSLKTLTRNIYCQSEYGTTNQQPVRITSFCYDQSGKLDWCNSSVVLAALSGQQTTNFARTNKVSSLKRIGENNIENLSSTPICLRVLWLHNAAPWLITEAWQTALPPFRERNFSFGNLQNWQCGNLQSALVDNLWPFNQYNEMTLNRIKSQHMANTILKVATTESSLD